MRDDVTRLGSLAGLMLDHKLARLRETSEALTRSREQIAALERPATPTDLPPVAADLVACTYRRWAEARRIELNTVLARQTAEWMAARAEAELAFGRAEALRQVAARATNRRR